MTEERKKKLAKRLKAKINKKDFKDLDEEIDFCIGSAIQFFLNFCNLENVPEEADFLIYDMALKKIEAEGLTKTEKEVDQIKRGDTTITYKKGDSNVSIFDDFKTRMYSFRRLKLPKRGV